VTKGTGTKENSYDYDPYGVMLHQTEGVSNPWKFAGGFLDSSTGLYKFGTRYDDPTLGRWTQQDPVGGSLGDLNAANRYTYAGDDPINMVDPSGNFQIFPLTGPPLGFNGIAILFSATELRIYSNPWLIIPLKIAIALAVNFFTYPLPEGFANYVVEEVPSSIVNAQSQCGSKGQGATIDYTFIDALIGGTPTITCS
jgi:RHS repeat-associated protein